MFTCSRCQVPNLAIYIERDAGDWIVRCDNCGAKNLLGVLYIRKVTLPPLEIIGWRD
jgi:DNA-directed RNA polymerase subunit RPC12/RpoP